MNDTDNMLELNPKLLSNMRTLINHFPEGILITDLAAKYLELTGSILDESELGFHNVQDLVNHLEEILHVNFTENGEWLLTNARFPPKPEHPKPEPIPKNILQNIYDLLKTEPNGYLLSDLEMAYEVQYEKSIPWKRLHYTSFEAFIQAVQLDLSVVVTPSGSSGPRIELIPAIIKEMSGMTSKQVGVPSDAIPLGEIYTYFKVPTEKDIFSVIVSEIETPGRFWLQLATSEDKKRNAELDHLMDELQWFYSTKKAERYIIPDHWFKQSMICSVLYLDTGEWHRGCIIEQKGPTVYTVFYFDYGTVEIVDKGSMRLLKKCFLELPAQAFLARLASTTPNDYSTEAKERMLSMVSNRPLMARITSRKLYDRISVFLLDTNGNDDIYINHVLQEEGHVVGCIDDDRPLRKPRLVTDLPVEAKSNMVKSTNCQVPPPPGFSTTPEMINFSENFRPVAELGNFLNPVIVRRVQLKRLAQKKLQIPTATVQPVLQTSGTCSTESINSKESTMESSEQETLVKMMPLYPRKK